MYGLRPLCVFLFKCIVYNKLKIILAGVLFFKSIVYSKKTHKERILHNK